MDKILLIDDESDVRYAFCRLLDSPKIQITTADNGEQGLKLCSQLRPDLVIMDIQMKGMNGLQTLEKIRKMDTRIPVIMMTAYGTTKTAIEAMKLGAYDYLLKPFDIPKMQQLIRAAIQTSRDMRRTNRLKNQKAPAEKESGGYWRVGEVTIRLENQKAPAEGELGIVGKSEPMQKVFKLIGQLAASQATALITGESGTGKEIVAQAVYQNSLRSAKPYLAVNCAAIPENLLESELFGHEKGAFTGANALRIGKFEQCHRGTIFLDEIGDMSLHTQTRILRVLQSGTFERVGGNKSIQVDVRIIAATNKNLEEAVAEKEFREDLFYRLNVVRIRLPALRERREDIRLLVGYFLKKFSASHGVRRKSISSNALRMLEEHDWPGNVRELENTLQRALVVAKGEAILISDLPPEVLGEETLPVANPSPENASPPTAQRQDAAEFPNLANELFQWAQKSPDLKILPAVERELVRLALQKTKGNQIQAASLLGITRATLRKRVEKFSIKQTLNIR